MHVCGSPGSGNSRKTGEYRTPPFRGTCPPPSRVSPGEACQQVAARLVARLAQPRPAGRSEDPAPRRLPTPLSRAPLMLGRAGSLSEPGPSRGPWTRGCVIPTPPGPACVRKRRASPRQGSPPGSGPDSPGAVRTVWVRWRRGQPSSPHIPAPLASRKFVRRPLWHGEPL